jgi:hypothetical protein
MPAESRTLARVRDEARGAIVNRTEQNLPGKMAEATPTGSATLERAVANSE